MRSPTISVVVPCYNHGEFLPEAVASVTSMHRDDVELIIVDDGSTDARTCKEVDMLRAQGHHVIRQDNRGLAAARNAGVRASLAPYLLPLDADNRLRPGYVENAIRIMNAEPQVGVVYGDAEYMGIRTGRWRVGRFDSDRLLHCNYIDACAAYRRAVWEQNGGYDGTMPAQGMEDWDFWLGALEHGWRFAYVPEVLFEYRVAEESMLTRVRSCVPQIERFVAVKHGFLYRQAWLLLMEQTTQNHESLKFASRNLTRLLRTRLRQKLGVLTKQD